MKDNKNQKYFCDSCGLPVLPGSEICSHCGKKFSGVRCPSCGYQGREGEFFRGCPVCGYLASSNESGSVSRKAGYRKREEPKSFRLPDWFFRTALIILLAAIGILVFLFGSRIY